MKYWYTYHRMVRSSFANFWLYEEVHIIWKPVSSEKHEIEQTVACLVLLIYTEMI